MLSLIGPAKTSNRPNCAGQHLGQRVLDLRDVLGRQVGDALLGRLAVHEPEQAHRLRVGVEVLVARLVRLGLDLLGDPDVLRAPDPVRRRQAGVVLARGRMVVGDGPLALRRGGVGDRRRVGAGEHDVGAGGEQRVGRLALLLRVVPGVDEPDVHRALGAGLLGAAHDRVAEAQLLGDREGRHVAELRIAVLLGARPGQHAGEVLHVLDRAEEVAEVLPVRLVAGQVQVGDVREFLGDRLHGVHVAERRADDEVEALARQAAEDLLGVGAFRDELDVGDVRVGHVLAEVLEALVVGLAPAAVVVRSDEHHRDVELARVDLRDLEVRAGLGAGPGAIDAAAEPLGAAEPLDPVVEQAPKIDDGGRQQRQQPGTRGGHGLSPPRRALGRVRTSGISALGSAIQRRAARFPAGTVAPKDSPPGDCRADPVEPFGQSISSRPLARIASATVCIVSESASGRGWFRLWRLLYHRVRCSNGPRCLPGPA